MFHVEQSEFHQSKALVFFSAHGLLFYLSLVFPPHQMKTPMCHYPAKLLEESHLVCVCIFLHPVCADEYIATQLLHSLILIGKRDDICVIIVIQVLLVYVQQVLICTKNKGDGINGESTIMYDSFQPDANLAGLAGTKCGFGSVKCNGQNGWLYPEMNLYRTAVIREHYHIR